MSEPSLPSTIESDIRIAQQAHRERIVASWDIEAGSKILEIGCGQGDLTEALARAVGPQGHVLAVDVAGRDYGSPLTLGEATDIVKSSPLGDRIEFRFNSDVREFGNDFVADPFDYVVMAHSSWYFTSLSELSSTLTKARGWSQRLCFAEWDLAPRSHDQMAHMLAVLIQGQVEAYKQQSEANVRTPFARSVLRSLLNEAGWHIRSEAFVDTGSLQDGDWEVRACLGSSLAEAWSLALPEKLLALVESEVEMLRELAKPRSNPSLPCYSIMAEREH